MHRLDIRRLFVFVTFLAISSASASIVHAANQTPDLSPIVIGSQLPFSADILPTNFSGGTLPSLHSFAKAKHDGQWLLIGGMSNGMHDLSGSTGFESRFRNPDVVVVDPNTQQVWMRSLATDPTAGLTVGQLESLMVTNSQFTQKGSHLYIAGGYGPTGEQWHTFDTLTSIDLPGLMDWVKSGTGTAVGNIRQINDPIFQVTGGEMSTSSNGKSHLIFGQNYPDNYEPRQDGEYTYQVRTFTIVDDAGGLSIADPVLGPINPDFRRRDLNVVPIIQNVGGQYVDKVQALSGVFTPSFGAWTLPVTIDGDGNATQPDPNAPGTFKQGMNGYRSGQVGLYSANTDTMYTLLLGGISFQFYDQASGQIMDDLALPFINDITAIVTDADGQMTQHLLDTQFPIIPASTNGEPLLLGTLSEFFLKDGIATYSNGVIDLDALTEPTLIGWLFGGIASDAPNGGQTVASNAMFPVIITPVPEPSLLISFVVGALALLARSPRRLALACAVAR